MVGGHGLSSRSTLIRSSTRLKPLNTLLLDEFIGSAAPVFLRRREHRKVVWVEGFVVVLIHSATVLRDAP